MAIYFNPVTKEYPRHDGDIKLINENWEPGQELPKPWVEVESVDMPEYTENQIAEEKEPIYENKKWTMNWSVRTMTEEEIIYRNLLKARNDYLLQKRLPNGDN